MSNNNPNAAGNGIGSNGWKAFSFFEKTSLTESATSSSDDLEQFLQSSQIAVAIPGRGNLILGDRHGTITFLNRSMALIKSFKAFPGKVTHLKSAKRKNILFSLGEDEAKTPVLKVWNLDKVDKQGQPSLLRSSKITHGSKVFPVTAFAVMEDLTQLAIGLENGVVLFMRGDFSQGRFGNPKMIHEGSEIVTALGFRDSGDGSGSYLYIVTLARILAYGTSASDVVKDVHNVLDDYGADVGCAALTPEESRQEMASVRPDGIYFYGPEGRGPCFLSEGEKTMLTFFKGYVAIVSQEKPMTASGVVTPSALTKSSGSSYSLQLLSDNNNETYQDPSGSGTTPIAIGSTSADVETPRSWNFSSSSTHGEGTILTLYDLKSKYIAYRGSFGTRKFDPRFGTAVGEPIRFVFSVPEWGELFVITAKNKIFRMRELDIEKRLGILYERKNFSLALSIVTSPVNSIHSHRKTQDTSPTNLLSSGTNDPQLTRIIMDIHKRYGDDAYTRGDFSLSMKQYLSTIGFLEPSYVIRKFLEPQRIQDLTLYLEALHKGSRCSVKGIAGPNHTTLLINCYTKLKDVKSLDAFLESVNTSGVDGDDATPLSFDVETAIKVCRQSGFLTQALSLAKKYRHHSWYMKIQMDDLKAYDEAAEYMKHCVLSMDGEQGGVDGFLEDMKTYGLTLVSERPEAMTDLLARVCCFYHIVSRGTGNGEKFGKDERKSGISTPTSLRGSRSILSESPSLSQFDTVGPSQQIPHLLSSIRDFVNALVFPEDFVQYYIHQPVWCIAFLENVLEKRDLEVFLKEQGRPEFMTEGISKREQLSRQVVAETLLELCLKQHAVVVSAEGMSTPSTDPSTTEQEGNASSIHTLKAEWREKIMSVIQNGQYYDPDHALVLCRTFDFGEGWVLLCHKFGLVHELLEYFIAEDKPEMVFGSCLEYGKSDERLWKKALEYFTTRQSTSKSDSLTKEQWFTLLSNYKQFPSVPNLTLANTREYLLHLFSSLASTITSTQTNINTLETSIAALRDTHTRLQGPIVFQKLRCELCQGQLELPSVYFHCMHGFHARCLGDDDQVCPLCVKEYNVVSEVLRGQAIDAERHDAFLEKLEEKGFEWMIESLSRNLFMKQPVP